MKLSTANVLKSGVAPLVLGVALLASPAMAQEAASPTKADVTTTDKGNAQDNVIVVTGSAIKRHAYDTASPVDIVTAKDILKSGFDTVASVLANATANGAGTLSNNNQNGFSPGASGVALRGLSVGATLSLVDGHRLAPYPLSDDGERQFVDTSSIPLLAIDHIDVEKDGASALYGSDAIAGVVNIVLKKQVTGLEVIGDAGTSQHGGGTSKHIGFATGVGDISRDGYNAFIISEYRDQDPIYLRQRHYQAWGNQNYARFGGNDLRPGVPNIFNGDVPNTFTPYFINPDNTYTTLGKGCNPATSPGATCPYTSPDTTDIGTRNIDVLLGITKDLGVGWEAKLKLSFFDSRAHSVGGYSVFQGPSYGGGTTIPTSGFPVAGVNAVPDYSLPVANFLGSGSEAGAYLQGVIPGLSPTSSTIDNKTYRAALDLTGNLAGWDVTGSLGYSEVVTVGTYFNNVNYYTFYNELIALDANPAATLSDFEAAAVAAAPTYSYTATDKLFYAEADGSRKLVDLPGGNLSMALGASVVNKSLNNRGPAPVLAGLVGGAIGAFAIGKQTDVAEFVELRAHLLNTIEVGVAARDDWYDTYGNSFTPKFDARWQPIRQLTMRGTFGNGFRAPSPAEVGSASSLFGLNSKPDPILCPNNGNGPWVIGDEPSTCGSSPTYAQRTNPLKPEKSTTYTLGAVVQPFQGWSLSADYYHIKIDNQIITAAELPDYQLSAANCVRGPDLPLSGGVVTSFNPDGSYNTGAGTPIAGPLAACLSGYVNAQTTTTSGLDIKSDFRHQLGNNLTLTTSFEWTHLFHYVLTAPSGIAYELAGTHGPSGVSGDTGNPRNRINASLGLDNGKASVVLSGY